MAQAQAKEDAIHAAQAEASKEQPGDTWIKRKWGNQTWVKKKDAEDYLASSKADYGPEAVRLVQDPTYPKLYAVELNTSAAERASKVWNDAIVAEQAGTQANEAVKTQKELDLGGDQETRGVAQGTGSAPGQADTQGQARPGGEEAGVGGPAGTAREDPQGLQEEVAQKYAASNAASTDLRAQAGLDTLEPSPHAATTIEEAAQTYDGAQTLARARKIIEDSRAGVRPPVPTREEVLHMDMAAAEAGAKFNQAKQAYTEAIDAGTDPTEAKRALDAAREDVDTLTLASKAQGKEQSVAFSARNSAFFEDLTPAGVYRDFTVAKGAKLTPDEAKAAEEMGRRLQKAQSDIELAHARAETARAQERIKQLEQQAKASTRRAGRSTGHRTAEQITAQRQAAVERIKAKLADSGQNVAMADPFGAAGAARAAKLLSDIAPDVMEVVRLYAEEGVVRLADVVARVRHHVGEDVLSDGDVQKIIAGDYEKKPVTRSEAAKQIAEWRKELRTAGVGDETRLKKSIADYEAKLKSGEFPKKAPHEVSPDLQALYVKKEALKAEAAAMRNRIRSAEDAKNDSPLKKFAREVFNLPRTIVASTDMSAGLNQGLFAAFTHPGSWGKSVWEGVKTIKNEQDFYNAIGKVRADKNFDAAVAGGLKIGAEAPTFDPGGDMMLSKLISSSMEVGTPVGKVGLNPVAASERAYVATLEKLRMDMFSNMVDKAEKGGLFGAFGKQKLTLQDYKDIAEYVNTATGAGTGKVASALKNLNNHVPVMFSPGYMVSRWKLASGTPLWNTIRRNPRVASMVLKDYVAFAGTAGGLLAGLKASGYDVDMDVHSNNFGRVKVGDETIDPFSGVLAPYRVIAQLTQGGTNTKGKPVRPFDASTALNYLQYKASPLPRAALDIGKGLTGQQSFGKSYDPRTAEGLGNIGTSLSPIAVQNVMEIWNDKSLTQTQKYALAVAAVLGVSANSTTEAPARASSRAAPRATRSAKRVGA